MTDNRKMALVLGGVGLVIAVLVFQSTVNSPMNKAQRHLDRANAGMADFYATTGDIDSLKRLCSRTDNRQAECDWISVR